MGGPLDLAKCASCEHYHGTPRGFGDLVATVARATGIERAVKAVSPNCGCGQRRAALNAAIPFSDQRKE